MLSCPKRTCEVGAYLTLPLPDVELDAALVLDAVVEEETGSSMLNAGVSS